MKRALFIAGAASAGLRPQPALAQRLALAYIVDRIPGITGIYARTLDAGPPLASVRADESFASASFA